MSYQTNASALLELLQNSQQYVSQKDNTWLKLSQGTHKLRICPPWSAEGLPVRMIINHQGYKNKDGYPRNPLCFNYCFTNQNIAEALVSKNVVKQEDLAFYGKFGCIFCKVSDLIIQTKGKKSNTFYAKPQFLWNVVNRQDSKVYKWTTSKKSFETIATFNSAYPTMFNSDNGADILVMAQGEGLQRKYVLNLIPTSTPLGIDLTVNPLHDLNMTMADGYRNLNETMELLLNTVPDLLPILGINPSQFMTSAPF